MSTSQSPSSVGGGSSIISFGFGSKKKKKQSDEHTSKSSESSSVHRLPPVPDIAKLNMTNNFAVRQDGFGYQPDHHTSDVKISSLSYQKDESEASRAFEASQHYKYRGKFWNEGKRQIMVRYFQLAMIGLCQGTIAYFVNFFCRIFTDIKFDSVSDYIDTGNWFTAFLSYFGHQLVYAAWASAAVMIEPMSGGSGIPEVKIFLNGINLPRINDLKTGVCKILGVVGSVSAGLPVGKEGPMVHSGSVVAAQVSKSTVRDDKTRRDFVACGAAAGVCTAFSAPIGGVLFALEEGASYWSQAVTFRTFFCSMCSIATLYAWNAVGAQFGKVGLDKLFSFGNFPFEGMDSSYSIWELLVFIFIGCMGGLIGAIFNNTNERLTHWRIKHVNHTKHRRFLEVLVISSVVSIIGFGVPFLFFECMDLPDKTLMDEKQADLVDSLVQFGCKDGQYHPIASLFFVDGNDAIKLLFHMHVHAFPIKALLLFFFFYISLATITYGIAVPSGLFVPSLLSGAAFGRLLGNLAYKLAPESVAFSNTYSLIGAASVLGGMARMTISLTVILLESTGNEQFVLPLMISLFCARIVGCLFNDDLYHIHIHLKAGVQFLDHQLRNLSGHHDLFAGHIMSKDVVFLRPIEKVGTVLDILSTCDHSCFPVVDTNDRDVLYGTISRHVVHTLLQQRAFGLPANTAIPLNNSIVQNHIRLNPDATFLPLIPYKVLEREDSSNIPLGELNINDAERELFLDLRPYCNTAPHTIQETTSVVRAYETFRTLGLRMLVVVNRYNQCVGTITRDDLTVEALAQDMITKGKNL